MALESIELTLERFTDGPVKGVPSRLSDARAAAAFDVGTDSSRTLLTFKSAYFRQFLPQVSQRKLVANPFGAFHHAFESRTRHAPQLGAFEGRTMIEVSSSLGPTIWPLFASSPDLNSAYSGSGGAPPVRRRSCSSPSLELEIMSV